MQAAEMWAAFAAQAGLGDVPWEAWAFGDAPDDLAQLVLRGVKTATSSAYALYALEGEPLPRAGEYSVILDGRGDACCVVQTTRVYVTPFDRVTPAHARQEGEGDRSLAHWRAVHQAFFTRCLAEAGLGFSRDMPVLCEEFRLAYPPPRPR